MSDVPELTAFISEMGHRIRQLEHAVSRTHTGGRASSHPLLASAPRAPAPWLPAQNVDDPGSFTVKEAGDAMYLGRTAGPEELLSSSGASGSNGYEWKRFSFTAVTDSFLFSSEQPPSWDADCALEQLLTHLPFKEKAWSLCETYYRNSCWTGMPIMQEEAVELLTQVYQPFHTEEHYSAVTTQKIAVLYLILALGSLVDLDLPPDSDEADRYFGLGSAAMSVRSVFEKPTVVAVQALVLIAIYYAHGGRRFSLDGTWAMISMASCIARTLGMHRESFGAKLPSKACNRCRVLFWETYSIETIYGCALGRPTGTFLSDITCPFPPDEDAEAQSFVKLYPGYRAACWEFTKQVTALIMERCLTTAKPNYDTVLDLDQKIRRYVLDSPFERFPTPENSPSSFIQRHLIPQFTKTGENHHSALWNTGWMTLTGLHNPSFFEAMRDNPANPLSSAYAASFLAAYRCASEVIRADIENFARYPRLFNRWWSIWKGLFNAALIVGTIATRYPKLKMTPHAIDDLLAAVDLIEKGAVSSGRARSGLAILERLRAMATAAHGLGSGRELHNFPAATYPDIKREVGISEGGFMQVFAQDLPSDSAQHPSPAHAHPGDSIPPHWPTPAEDVQREFAQFILPPSAAAPYENVAAGSESFMRSQGGIPYDQAAHPFSFPPHSAVGANFRDTQGAFPQGHPSAHPYAHPPGPAGVKRPVGARDQSRKHEQTDWMMLIHDLDVDVLVEILCFCDVYTVLTVAQVYLCDSKSNAFASTDEGIFRPTILRTIALAKPVWLALVADLNARCLMDPLPMETLAGCSTSDLITEVRRLVCGPGSSAPVTSRVRFVEILPSSIPRVRGAGGQSAVKLLPGGRYIAFFHDSRFECWNASSGTLEMLDGGNAYHCLLVPHDSQTLEVLHVYLLTGHSELLFRPPPSPDLTTLLNIKHYPASLSGDFFTVVVRLDGGTAVLLVNWRETTYILFRCSPSWTTPTMLVVSGHLILSTAALDPPYPPLLIVYDIASITTKWRPVAHINLSVPSQITPLHVDDLGIGRIWRMDQHTGPVKIRLAVYRSPLRHDLTKLVLYIFGVILIDPEEHPNKRSFMSVFRQKRLSRPTAASGVLFTYHLSEPAAGCTPSKLPLIRSSAIPSVVEHWFHEMSYAGYALNAVDGSVLDLRLRRPEPDGEGKNLCILLPHLSASSGAVTRVVDSGVMVEYQL
ncbi:hypothetical protein C8R44DRAFT_885298 [Mycena epipterygia]|nr:hypothetical protein C8R44DRAFT_885298 [Mycena epipterygia]